MFLLTMNLLWLPLKGCEVRAGLLPCAESVRTEPKLLISGLPIVVLELFAITMLVPLQWTVPTVLTTLRPEDV